ncbi:YidH family protein [Nocardia sp. NPDC057353]|uniref:YidH family protein n=1 Tax=Nocardia sp. NPDC057353 TaxID=3346104 RepID=UPI00362AFC39
MIAGPGSAAGGEGSGVDEAENGSGPEVDYRFTLANERTFLAWIRTSLGLLAGGVAVHTLVQPFQVTGFRRAIAVSCVALAVVLAVGALLRWRRVTRAMHAGRALPETVMVPILAVGIAVIAFIAALAVLIE